MTAARSTASIGLVIAAARFAADRHRDQRRKGGDVPYVNHPLTVADILVHEGGIDDPETLAAAILHDTIEDTDTTAEELTTRFGATVAAIVREVTDDRSLPKADRKRAQIAHAPHMSPAARLVKLADKLANLRDLASMPPPNWSAERILGYFCWAHAVVEALGPVNDRLRAALDAVFAADLALDGTRIRAVPADPAARAARLAEYLAP